MNCTSPIHSTMSDKMPLTPESSHEPSSDEHLKKGSNTSTKTSPTLRACEACRSRKIRCLPQGSSKMGKCQRCDKSDRECIFTAPEKRRRRKRTDTRVADLEQMVQVLAARLEQEQRARLESEAKQKPHAHAESQATSTNTCRSHSLAASDNSSELHMPSLSPSSQYLREPSLEQRRASETASPKSQMTPTHLSPIVAKTQLEITMTKPTDLSSDNPTGTRHADLRAMPTTQNTSSLSWPAKNCLPGVSGPQVDKVRSPAPQRNTQSTFASFIDTASDMTPDSEIQDETTQQTGSYIGYDLEMEMDAFQDSLATESNSMPLGFSPYLPDQCSPYHTGSSQAKNVLDWIPRDYTQYFNMQHVSWPCFQT